MTATADMIIERRRIRRKLTFWRIVAIVAAVIAVIALLPRWGGGPVSGSYIARIHIEKIILDDPKRERMIRSLAEDDNVEAMIVRINSPGGTVAASETLYQAIRAVAEQKPVVAVMHEYAASGGYVTAIAADHIVANGNTLTGSIGVVAEIPNIAGLMEMLGVDVTRIKSAPLKAEPTITEAPSPAALAAQEALIQDMFAWFKGLVSDRRGLEGDALAAVTDGRAFTGRQALELGLVDAIGTEETALDWLAEAREIDRETRVIDRDWDDEELPWGLAGIQDAAATIAGVDRLMGAIPRLYAVIQ